MNYRPEISAFSSGAIVMIFEILGARILGAYTGNSLFVWTSIIALILGALALGYYIGGEYADKYTNNSQRYKLISLLFLGASLSFIILPYISDILLSIITHIVSDIRLSSLIGTSILFVPGSLLLGMIPPLCTKIHLNTLEDSGKVVGKIGSLGTAGSIIGTISAGFFLIPFFGIQKLLIFLAFICLILSYLNAPRKYTLFHIFVAMCICITFFIFSSERESLARDGRVVLESAYSHITIVDGFTGPRLTRKLYIDNINHSGMYLDGSDLFAHYTKAYHLFDRFVPDSKNILMLGGAAYGFPKSFLLTYPEKNIDVVEIDPMMTQLAKKYFYLPDDPRLNTIHQDARVYLNSSDKKYDAILGDAFGSYFSIPFQLTTLEAVQKKYDMLTDNGVVILNIISAQEGETSKFLQAEYLTYQQVFPEVFIMPISTPHKEAIQNIILVAAKNPETLEFTHQNQELQSFLDRRTYMNTDTDTKILTDNYAPVDYYISMLTY